MKEQPRILIANADDFGLSKGINRGILSAYQQGIVRSVSLAPNGPAFEDAVEIISSNPGLDVGIHLCLVGDKSLAAPPNVRGLADPEHRLAVGITKTRLISPVDPMSASAVRVTKAIRVALEID